MTTINRVEGIGAGLRAITLRSALPWAIVALGAAVWLLTLQPIGPDDVSDIGLVVALPAGWWVGVGLASLALGYALTTRPVDTRVGVAAVLLLAVILYATPAMTEALPRFNTVYVHLGFIEAIERTNRLFPDLDARFSWPVFFTAMAGVTRITGVDLLDIAAWVPLLSTLAVLPAMWLLVRAFTDDTRLSLLALWMLLVGNWVGQDYLSPQGFNFVVYVWFLALAAWFYGSSRERLVRLRALLRRPMQPPPSTIAPTTDHRVRGALILVLVGLAAISVSSHQLTPFAMVGASLVLVLFGRTTLRWLPLVVGVMTAVWVVFAGYTFLAGHIEPLLRDIGNVSGAGQSGVVDRIRGNDGHMMVVTERIAFSLVVWGLGGLGVLRRLWSGHWDIAAVLLAFFPFGLIPLQSYGGEIFLRVFLFALPGMAFLGAAAILPPERTKAPVVMAFLVVLTLPMVFGFVVGKHGNEIADIVTPAELEATDRMHALATPDTVMAVVNYNSPIRYRNVEAFDFFDVPSSDGGLNVTNVVTQLDAYAQGRPALLLVSRGQLALERLNGATADQLAAFTASLDASKRLAIVFHNADGTVYRLVGGTAP